MEREFWVKHTPNKGEDAFYCEWGNLAVGGNYCSPDSRSRLIHVRSVTLQAAYQPVHSEGLSPDKSGEQRGYVQPGDHYVRGTRNLCPGQFGGSPTPWTQVPVTWTDTGQAPDICPVARTHARIVRYEYPAREKAPQLQIP